jgi:hypothetical protein
LQILKIAVTNFETAIIVFNGAGFGMRAADRGWACLVLLTKAASRKWDRCGGGGEGRAIVFVSGFLMATAAPESGWAVGLGDGLGAGVDGE